MSGLVILVTWLDGNLAECPVLYNGEHVCESSWVYEPWNDHWTYSGDSRDCWADDDLLSFLDVHDRDENPDVEHPVGPEDLRALADEAIKQYERLAGSSWPL